MLHIVQHMSTCVIQGGGEFDSGAESDGGGAAPAGKAANAKKATKSAVRSKAAETTTRADLELLAMDDVALLEAQPPKPAPVAEADGVPTLPCLFSTASVAVSVRAACFL